MWIRIGTFAVKPGAEARLKSAYNDLALPKVRACAGSLACLLLEPQNAGDAFAVITIWASQADAEAYEASGSAAEVISLVRDCFAGPPTLATYQSDSRAGLAAGI